VIAYNNISTAVDGLADRLGSFADEFGVVVSREIDNTGRPPDAGGGRSKAGALRRRPACPTR
jgi:hypothetical protein